LAKKTFKFSRSKGWGGRRANAGNRPKYTPITIDFPVDSEKDFVKLLKMVPRWILQDQINTYRGHALVYTLKTLIEVAVPIQKIQKQLEDFEMQMSIFNAQNLLEPPNSWRKAYEELSPEDRESLQRISRKLVESQIKSLEVTV